jgi:hypothetical protein
VGAHLVDEQLVEHCFVECTGQTLSELLEKLDLSRRKRFARAQQCRCEHADRLASRCERNDDELLRFDRRADVRDDLANAALPNALDDRFDLAVYVIDRFGRAIDDAPICELGNHERNRLARDGAMIERRGEPHDRVCEELCLLLRFEAFELAASAVQRHLDRRAQLAILKRLE